MDQVLGLESRWLSPLVQDKLYYLIGGYSATRLGGSDRAVARNIVLDRSPIPSHEVPMSLQIRSLVVELRSKCIPQEHKTNIAEEQPVPLEDPSYI